jgi:hypothetical protein
MAFLMDMREAAVGAGGSGGFSFLRSAVSGAEWASECD